MTVHSAMTIWWAIFPVAKQAFKTHEMATSKKKLDNTGKVIFWIIMEGSAVCPQSAETDLEWLRGRLIAKS